VKRRYFFLLHISLLFFVVIGSPLQAAEPLLITRGTDRATPIAVVPFGWQGDEAQAGDMAQIVADDLRNSGLFAPIERQNMISLPAKADEIIYRDFQALSAQYLLIGNVTANAGRLDVEFSLYNVSTEQRLFSGRTNGTVQQLRAMAHYISDQAYQNLTGSRGAFSTRLLYVTAERLEGNKQRFRLYRADYDGARPVLLLESSEPILSPRYSPDGKQVAYVSFESRRPRIFIQQVASGQREQITDFEGLNGAPAFSPDGKQLALVLSRDGNPEIYVMDLASRALTRITNHFAIDTEPFWGADGKTLYFTSDRSGKPQIYKTTLAGGEPQRVTFEGNYNANAKLSADEKTLVMVHRQDGYTNFKVAAQNLERGNLRILSETSLDDSPTVAPNGSMLIYATRQQGQGALVLVSINGRVRITLPTARGDVREPSWSPWLD